MADFSFLIWNNMPWVWLALVVIFAVIEALTMSLTTIWFALGAVAMIFLSMAHIPLPVQIILFALISCVLLVFTRPVAIKKLNMKNSLTNADSLIGMQVVVQDAIEEMKKGTVKINGVVWNAIADNSGEANIQSGTKCTVTAIKGNTLVLRRTL